MLASKRIVFYLMSFNRGGAEWVITNLCNEMTARGHKITVMIVSSGDMEDELDPTIEIKSFNGRLLDSLKYLYKLLRGNTYDALFTTQRLATAYAYFPVLFSFTKTKFIVREAASNFKYSYENKSQPARSLWKSLYKRSYNKADRIIVNSPGTKADLIRAGIINDNNKSFIINNPLDLNKIKSRSFEESIDPVFIHGKFLISIGRLVPKKNMDIIIKAFSEIKDLYADLNLIIVGDGPEKDNLDQLIVSLGLKERVFMTGNLSNPYPYLKKAEIFILASQWEGFGMVIVEALCLGIPVIATDIDAGPRQILGNHEFGTLIKPNSVEALKDAIIMNMDVTHNTQRLVDRANDFDKAGITTEYLEVMFCK